MNNYFDFLEKLLMVVFNFDYNEFSIRTPFWRIYHSSKARFSFLESLFVLLYFFCYYLKWHPFNTVNEREFTRTLKITYKFETNCNEKVFVKVSV